MPRSVYLVQTARRQLQQIAREPCLAWLLGWRGPDRIEILNVCRFLSTDGQILKTTETPYALQAEMDALAGLLPGGVVPLGCAAVYGDEIQMSVLTLVKSLIVLSSKAIKLCSPASEALSGVWCVGELTLHLDRRGCDFENIQPTQSVFLTQWQLLKWRLDLAVSVSPQSEGRPIWPQFSLALEGWMQRGTTRVVVEDRGRQRILISPKDRRTLGELFTKSDTPLQCTVLVALENGRQRPVLCVPQSKVDGTGGPARTLRLTCSVWCYAWGSLRLSDLFQQCLLSALESQLRQCSRVFAATPSATEISALHFDVGEYVGPLCVVYPFGAGQSDESSQIGLRQQLHRRFLLKLDQPVFLSVCSKEHAPAKPRTEKPVNIHLQLPKKNFSEGGMTATVAGSYEYCHYGHDAFDDRGWGCAYRSLQTVFSWFVHQHYTQLPIPSHKKIQGTLIEMGQREGKFYGSCDWIGSVEVGEVLQDLLGVEYRIVNKAAHQDVASVARELLHHFQTQGTPISIGGGVLAYTLLGIYFHDQTAEVELLILDPHYTGRDVAADILRGGWVAWKKPTEKAAAGGPLFAPNEHYNFMCPYRPNSI